MKRGAQPLISAQGRQALEHYTFALQEVEDLSTVTIRNYLSDPRQFLAWYEYSWCDTEEERSFTQRAITPPLLALPELASNQALAEACTIIGIAIPLYLNLDPLD